MRKTALVFSIFVLILITSVVKNSTKEIEDKIYSISENIRFFKVEFSNLTLEYNYLSSPEKLIQYQSQYFENDLINIDITKIKKISEENKILELTDFIKKDNNE
tara:strand:+ start:220 stop:531 length:312 start_codon:yes stop_codon:yes gene_type:complete